MRWFWTRILTEVGDTVTRRHATRRAGWRRDGPPGPARPDMSLARAASLRLASARHTPEEATAQDVEVQMGHGVRGVITHVEHQPVTGLGDPGLARHPLGGDHQLGQEVTVGAGERGGRGYVATRDDQHVGGRSR